MAAGLGFKDFATGEVLTAADVDGYLMQGVWVFASAAARDAAVTSPQEGNFAYLKDTNVTTYYTGSTWANLDTTGMTNPMTTTGDTIYSSSGSTPARLGIGSTGQVLTVAGGVPSWATPAGGSTFVGAKSTRIGSAAQSISNSTFTACLWTSNTYDTDAIHDTSSNTDRFTVPAGKGGKWAISASVLFAGSSTGERRIAIYKNGSAANTDQRINGQGSGGLTASVNSVFNLVATDYLSVYVYQDSSGSLNIDEDLSWCSIYYLGA
jgi:hypothetical protein